MARRNHKERTRSSDGVKSSVTVHEAQCNAICAPLYHIMYRRIVSSPEWVLMLTVWSLRRFHPRKHGSGSEVVALLEARSTPVKRMPCPVGRSANIVHGLWSRIMVKTGGVVGPITAVLTAGVVGVCGRGHGCSIEGPLFISVLLDGGLHWLHYFRRGSRFITGSHGLRASLFRGHWGIFYGAQILEFAHSHLLADDIDIKREEHLLDGVVRETRKQANHDSHQEDDPVTQRAVNFSSGMVELTRGSEGGINAGPHKDENATDGVDQRREPIPSVSIHHNVDITSNHRTGRD